jgi:hypothetical protein
MRAGREIALVLMGNQDRLVFMSAIEGVCIISPKITLRLLLTALGHLATYALGPL